MTSAASNLEPRLHALVKAYPLLVGLSGGVVFLVRINPLLLGLGRLIRALHRVAAAAALSTLPSVLRKVGLLAALPLITAT